MLFVFGKGLFRINMPVFFTTNTARNSHEVSLKLFVVSHFPTTNVEIQYLTLVTGLPVTPPPLYVELRSQTRNVNVI